MGIEQLRYLLEEEELGHCIGDLTRPEGNERTEGVASVNFGFSHLAEGSTEGNGESARRASLDLDLGHLKGTKGNVCKNFS